MAHLRKYLLHLPEYVAKHRRLLDPHPIWPKAEAEPPGTVKGVLWVTPETIIAETVLFILIVVVIVRHGIKKRVPGTLE